MGVLYFNQIRLWKNAYFSTNFISIVEIKSKSLFPNLLDAWNGYYGDKKVDAVYPYNPVLNDIKNIFLLIL